MTGHAVTFRTVAGKPTASCTCGWTPDDSSHEDTIQQGVDRHLRAVDVLDKALRVDRARMRLALLGVQALAESMREDADPVTIRAGLDIIVQMARMAQ
jgi:hypothetical protein